MKSMAKGKKRIKASALLLDLFGQLIELKGKQLALPMGKKKVYWKEPLVGEGKD